MTNTLEKPSRPQQVPARLGFIKSLKAYGLNPREWRIHPESSVLNNMVILQNQRDRHFQLIAHLERTERSSVLKDLQLLSV